MIITVLHCRERKKRGRKRGRERGMWYWKRGAIAAAGEGDCDEGNRTGQREKEEEANKERSREKELITETENCFGNTHPLGVMCLLSFFYFSTLLISLLPCAHTCTRANTTIPSVTTACRTAALQYRAYRVQSFSLVSECQRTLTAAARSSDRQYADPLFLSSRSSSYCCSLLQAPMWFKLGLPLPSAFCHTCPIKCVLKGSL